MNRRRRKFIRTDMQLKVVLITAFVACLSLLIQLQTGLSGLWGLSSKLPASASAEVALDQARLVLINKFVLSVIVAVPLAISVGIIYSFRFSGPIYRFKKYFVDLAKGRWDEPLLLRKGDDLNDVADAINAGLDALRAHLKETGEVLDDLDPFFADASFTADGRASERLRRLKERIALGRAAYAARFPAQAPAAPAQSPEPAPVLAGGAR